MHSGRWSRSSWQDAYSIHRCSGSDLGVRGSVTCVDTSLHRVCTIPVFTTTSFCVYVHVGHSAPLHHVYQHLPSHSHHRSPHSGWPSVDLLPQQQIAISAGCLSNHFHQPASNDGRFLTNGADLQPQPTQKVTSGGRLSTLNPALGDPTMKPAFFSIPT